MLLVEEVTTSTYSMIQSIVVVVNQSIVVISKMKNQKRKTETDIRIYCAKLRLIAKEFQNRQVTQLISKQSIEIYVNGLFRDLNKIKER